MSYQSIPDIFYQQSQERPSKAFLWRYVDDSYQSKSFDEVRSNIESVVSWLKERLLDSETACIWAPNAWQWAVTDLSIMARGAVSIPIYPTSSMESVSYIFKDATPRLLFVRSLNQEMCDVINASSIETVVLFQSLKNDVQCTKEIIDFDSIIQQNMESSIEWNQNQLKKVATIVYTSGTTGDPKGVPLTHQNIITNIMDVQGIVPLSSADSVLSFLPLSHAFERTVGFHCIMSVGAGIYYAESMDTVARDLMVARPTILISVPRLFEKIYDRVMTQATGLKRVILKLALWIGESCSNTHPLWKLANMMVFKKIHQRTGGCIRFMVSGGAPLPAHVEAFFKSVGLTIIQGYGLTETAPIISVNRLTSIKMGSVGTVLPSVSVKLGIDKELLVKGNNVFSGYYNTSDSQQLFDSDGYFHTGDIADIDDEGFIYITDRKKEIIILSNGKNISPNRVEGYVLSSKYVDQVVVIGDQHHFLTALIVPHMETVRSFLQLHLEDDVMVGHEEVIQLIQQEIDQYSKPLSRFETIRKFCLLPDELTIESGDLTPTLKYRRSQIRKKYQLLIDSMYDDSKVTI